MHYKFRNVHILLSIFLKSISINGKQFKIYYGDDIFLSSNSTYSTRLSKFPSHGINQKHSHIDSDMQEMIQVNNSTLQTHTQQFHVISMYCTDTDIIKTYLQVALNSGLVTTNAVGTVLFKCCHPSLVVLYWYCLVL